jgi:hypothetical protein
MSKPFRLKPPEPSEAAVLRAVLQALALHPRVAWAQRMNSGAAWLPGRGGKQLVRFGFPGCPDVMFQIRDGRFGCVEVKRPSGKTTPEQAAFLDCVNANGGLALVARSASDVWEALNGAAQETPK